jgi:hypothetical protein
VMLTIETVHSLSVSIRYNSELFDAATITRIAKHFETLLRHVATQADARLNALKNILASMDKQALAATRLRYREANLQRLKTVKRVPVSVSQLSSDGTSGYGTPGRSDHRAHLHLNGASPGSKH